MKVKVAITTCVYPYGCKALVESLEPVMAQVETPDHRVQVGLFMDGNREYFALQAMPEYERTFAGMDRYVNLTDVVRLKNDNFDVQDYEWLREYEESGVIHVERHTSNLGAVPNFNSAMAWCRDADLAVLLMDDIVVKPGWLACMEAAFRHDAFASVAFAGFSNIARVSDGFLFPDKRLGHFDHLMSAVFVRGTYLRELLCERGWVFCPEYSMLCADAYLINETLLRGHDIGFVAANMVDAPRDHHRSLGNWQFKRGMNDKRLMQDGLLPQAIDGAVPGGHVYVKPSADGLCIEEWRRG